MNKFPIKEFLIGGILYSAIKYSSDNVSDIRVSSAIAAFPIGLLSSILINDKFIKKYTKSYMINVFFLLITAFLFYNSIKGVTVLLSEVVALYNDNHS